MISLRDDLLCGAIAANLAGHEDHIRADLDGTGLARLPGAVTQEWLAAARADIDAFVARHGSGEHSLVDTDRWECPSIAALATDGRVQAFLHTQSALPKDARHAGYRQRVLRILDGAAVDSPPFDWHYDANAITLLVPIVVPDDATGHLALFPDHRPHRRWATLSAAERLIVHNPIYGRWMRRRYDRDPAAHTLSLRPGDAYLFRGYRSLHATLPWPKDKLRVTLLLQYGYPYGPEGRGLQAIRDKRNSARKQRTYPH